MQQTASARLLEVRACTKLDCWERAAARWEVLQMWPGRQQAGTGRRRSLRCCASLELTEENVEAVLLVGHCALRGAFCRV